MKCFNFNLINKEQDSSTRPDDAETKQQTDDAPHSLRFTFHSTTSTCGCER